LSVSNTFGINIYLHSDVAAGQVVRAVCATKTYLIQDGRQHNYCSNIL